MNGELFNSVFEEFMNWHVNSGIIDISGRDICCMIVGFCICLMLWGIFDGKEIHVIRRRKDKDISGDERKGI